MEDPVAQAILGQYFRRLEDGLEGLPAERRKQIVEDLRAHVLEALDAETKHNDAAVLAILDRLGDPDEIVREALADEDARQPDTATAAQVTARRAVSPLRSRPWRTALAAALVLVAAAVIAVISLTGASTPRTSNAALRTVASTCDGMVASAPPPGTNADRWLPASYVSGGGGIDNSDCSPQTMSGSESVSALEASATQVASGHVAGHVWSLWSKDGKSGATGLEDGGVVVDGVAHGLCPAFPNPIELEMLEPTGGGDAIAYGVVGYPGAAKVNIYSSTTESFRTDRLLASTTAQTVNGVGFFVTALSQSGCALGALELNTASTDYAAEHSFGFDRERCEDGQLVPIDDSAGIWQLPTNDFPNRFPSANGGGLVSTPTAGTPAVTLNKNGWLPASEVSGGRGIDNSDCARQTLSGSESPSVLSRDTTEVASGNTGGHTWSLWSKQGESGATGLEDGGVIIDGVAHGLCPGFPNPGEMEMLDPTGDGDGLAYGVVGYPGAAKVDIYQGTVESFDTGRLLASTTAQKVNGVGFFITPLSKPACDISAVELNTASADYATEHNLGFNSKYCKSGELVPISWSQGTWQLPTSGFPDRFQSTTGVTSVNSGGGRPSLTGPDFSSCSPPTDVSSSGQSRTSIADASEVTSGTIGGHSWSLWSKHGESGSAALENAGVIVDGHAYGICPGTPNPAEFELIDPANSGNGVVIGVSGYTGAASVKLSVGTADSFRTGATLYSGETVAADGTGFFIAQLPHSACDYRWLELYEHASGATSRHVLGFGPCSAGKLSPIIGGEGAWGTS